MPSAGQGNKPDFSLQVSTLPDETLQVFSFEGEEMLSQLFRFDLALISKEDSVSFQDVINQPANFILRNGAQETQIQGLLIDFYQGGKVGGTTGNEWTSYRATLVPRMWVLGLFFNSRVFQNMTVKEIIEKVFTDAGFSSSDYQFNLSASYSPREYCVQYNETDLDFVMRLMEEEGIFYFFKPGDSGETVVLTDTKDSYGPIEGDAKLIYNVAAGMSPSQLGEQEFIREFFYKEQVVTGKVVLKDYNYRTPATDLKSESQINSDMPGQHYEYGAHFKTASEGQRLAKVRNEEMECRRRVVTGVSNSKRLRPGFTFTFDGYYRDDRNTDYLITEVRHSGAQGGATAAPGGEVKYTVDFVAIPADVQFRAPRITPVPKIPGIMTAKIEAQDADAPLLDDQGQYRAKMFFDLESTDPGQGSRPIRMSQPHSGPGYGIHFPHHRETEVVLAHLDGNPDRPLALGSVPNPDQGSPAASENKMQNVVRTFAGNQLVMDDTKDEQQITLNTPALNTLLLDDKDDRISITTEKLHTAVFDDKNKNILVKTTSGHTLIFDDDKKNVTLKTKDGHKLVIHDQEKKITVADSAGDHTFTIDIGGKKLIIKTTGSIDMHAPQGTIDIKAKELKCETTADTSFKALNLKSEAQKDMTLKGGMNLKGDAGMDMTLKGGMNFKAEGGLEMKLKGGMSLTAESGLQTQVKGTMVTVQASGVNTIQGSLVKIN